MGKFIILSFLGMGLVFYEMSGGTEFEPELREPIAVAATDLTPATPVVTQPEVTRADTASLIQIAAPAAAIQPIAAPVRSSAPLPAGEVIITPAPQAVIENVAATPIEEIVIVDAPRFDDLRAVSGDWVNMRSGPSTNYDVLDTLPRGTQAEVMEVDADGWARIRVTNTGQEGWMAERLLSDS